MSNFMQIFEQIMKLYNKEPHCKIVARQSMLTCYSYHIHQVIIKIVHSIANSGVEIMNFKEKPDKKTQKNQNKYIVQCIMNPLFTVNTPIQKVYLV